jgi:hypothetical protein
LLVCLDCSCGVPRVSTWNSRRKFSVGRDLAVSDVGIEVKTRASFDRFINYEKATRAAFNSAHNLGDTLMAEVTKVPFTFKTKKFVVKQLFKIKPGVEYYFKATGPMHIGKQIDDQKEAATLMDVIDLPTGELGQIICGKLLRDSLAENYPNHSYVGKAFCIELMKVPEKRYNMLKTFNEIDLDEAPKAGVKK